MKGALIFALAGLAVAQVPGSSASENIGTAPAGCDKSYDGNFEITLVQPSNLKRDIAERQDASTCGQEGILTLNLKNGNLMDVTGKTGYIASNNSQFQFDKPVQAGGIYAGEFSVCKNGSIALGGTTTFYQCKSGGFYNLYFKAAAEQCSPVNFDIIPCNGAKSSASAGTSAAAATPAAVSAMADGQPQATAAASVKPVSVFTDGQPQATAPATSVIAPKPVSVFTDGQPQATVAATSKAASNVTTATAVPTIATAGGAANTVSVFLAGAMAVLALI